MNWQAINFDWNQVRAFLATVDEGSLSAAGRVLGQTQPTVGRQVTALEDDLGVVLFERSGRHLIPTPAAHVIADHVRAMAEAATKLSLAASGQSQVLEGSIKITATEMYSAMVLPAFVEKMQAEYPGVTIEIVATNSLSNLRQREADIAIRNTDPKDPDMIARRMADEQGGLFTTTGFIEKHGPFRSLADVKGVPFIGLGSDSLLVAQLQERGVPVTEADIAARSESHLVHWELARRGLGFGLNGTIVGSMTPGMVPVLEDHLRFEFPVWLVAPQELKTNARVRLVFDALAQHLTEFALNAEAGTNSA